MEQKASYKGLTFVLGWKDIVFVLIAGIVVTLGLGVVENTSVRWFRQNEHYYGYPIAWRFVDANLIMQYRPWYLLADFALWVAAVFMITSISKVVGQKLES